MRKTINFIILCSLFTFLTIGSVSASWFFAQGDATGDDISLSMGVSEWYFPENLPGGGENAEEEFDDGISHAGIIQDIIDDIEKYSPTNNDSSIIGAIEGAIEAEQQNGSSKDHNGVGSSTKYNGISLRDFAGANGYENLGFFVYYGPDVEDVSEITTLEIYTYALSDTTQSVGRYIEVYKTIAELVDGTWRLRGGWKGTAPIVKYGNSNTTGKYKNVIDATLWVKTE